MATNTSQRKPAWADWFNGRQAIRNLPPACIRDCASQGRVDDAVRYWTKATGIDAPPWLLRKHLKEYGAWDKGELCNHRNNLQRLLWLWAIDCHENGHEFQIFLGL